MRLLDQVVQARKDVVIQQRDGRILHIPGAAHRAADLVSTPLRYVFDEAASRQCAAFIRSNEGMFDPENDLLHVVADRFWLEWNQGASHQPGASPQRAGVLVDSTSKGRRGVVQSFWEEPGRDPEMAQATIEFDLDQAISGKANGRDVHDLIARDGNASKLVPHLLVRIHPEWIPELSGAGPQRLKAAVSQIGLIVWRDLIFALAFSAIMSTVEVLSETPVTRDKLNIHRAKGGKAPLLDHTEVTISLGRSASRHAWGDGATDRHGPRRLHYVRGHMVRRFGKMFWRVAHLRGDASIDPMVRTVRVKGRTP